MDYLHWAKTRRKTRYQLTASGVPGIRPSDIDINAAPLSFEVKGTYGDPELIDTVAARYQCHADGVVPVPGASTANFIALAAAVGRGARVAVEHPVYEPIARVASFLDLRVRALPRAPQQGFGVTVDDLEAALAQGAQAVVLTNLHNPSGRWLPAEKIAEFATRCAAGGATLVVDEVYLDGRCLAFGEPLWTAAVTNNVIACNSLTKVYGLGGLRVGWLVANADVAERARHIMDLLSVDNAAPSASLALQALRRIDLIEARYRSFYEPGQAVYRRWLAGEPLVEGYQSYGALCECVRLPEGVTGSSLNDLLVAEYDTQVVPGRFFDLDDHVRISIGLLPEDLSEGLTCLSEALRQLVQTA